MSLHPGIHLHVAAPRDLPACRCTQVAGWQLLLCPPGGQRRTLRACSPPPTHCTPPTAPHPACTQPAPPPHPTPPLQRRSPDQKVLQTSFSSSARSTAGLSMASSACRSRPGGGGSLPMPSSSRGARGGSVPVPPCSRATDTDTDTPGQRGCRAAGRSHRSPWLLATAPHTQQRRGGDSSSHRGSSRMASIVLPLDHATPHVHPRTPRSLSSSPGTPTPTDPSAKLHQLAPKTYSKPHAKKSRC